MKMMTTQEWQESISLGIKSLTENMEKIAEAFLSSKPVVKENLITEKPLPKQVASDEYDNMSVHDFEKRMWLFAIINCIFSVVMAIVSFQYVQIMYGFWHGLSTSTFFLIQLLLVDKYLLKGYTLGKISNSANAVVGFWAIIAFVFIFGYLIGNTLISDPARGEEYKQPNIERQYKNIDSIAPENSNGEFGNSGSSER